MDILQNRFLDKLFSEKATLRWPLNLKPVNESLVNSLKNTLRCWFLVKLLALEQFSQKLIYWTPFGGCLESYFQLQLFVHYGIFQNFFTSSFYHIENNLIWFPNDCWTGCQNFPFYGFMWVQKHSLYKESF